MSLFEHLKLIEDPSSHINLNHDLVDIIFLVLAAITSGVMTGKLSKNSAKRTYLGYVNIEILTTGSLLGIPLLGSLKLSIPKYWF